MRKVRLDGKKVKALREARDRGATQKEFAPEFRAGERLLRMIENRDKPIGIDLAGRIADALNQPLEELLLQGHENQNASPHTARPQTSTENHPMTETGDDLIALGPDIVVAGELMTVGSTEWVVRIKKFVGGDISTLVAFIDRFGASPPNDRYVLVNALGDGRSYGCADADEERGRAFRPLRGGAGFSTQRCATPPHDGHIARDQRSLYRKRQHRARFRHRRAPSIRAAMPLDAPRRPFNPDYGARLAEYFHRFRGSPYLAAVFKLEVIRQAAIPYANDMTGRSDTPLHCVERVLSVKPLSDAAENGRLPVGVAFDVNGAGRWEQEMSISMPDGATLEKIRERGKVHAAIHAGRVVTRGMVEAVTATDKLSRMKLRMR